MYGKGLKDIKFEFNFGELVSKSDETTLQAMTSGCLCNDYHAQLVSYHHLETAKG